MMQNRSIKDFMVQVLIIWSISLASVCVACALFGDAAKGNSSFFELGSAGIPIKTIAQFYLFAIVVTSVQWICFTDMIIKKLGLTARRIMMFVGIPVAGGVFAFCFNWFPIKELRSWLSFLACYGICTAVSVFVSDKLDKRENLRMQDALERLQAKAEEGEEK